MRTFKLIVRITESTSTDSRSCNRHAKSASDESWNGGIRDGSDMHVSEHSWRWTGIAAS